MARGLDRGDLQASRGEDRAQARGVGDDDAVRRLYAEHRRSVTRVVRLCGAPAEAVDDLVQETFLRAIERLPHRRRDASLSAWLHGIALNLTRAHRTKSSRRRGLLARAMPALEPAPPQQEARTDDRRALNRLVELLGRLPDADREAFVLRNIEHLSLEETAEICKVAVSTVSDRARRAESKLRQWMEGYER